MRVRVHPHAAGTHRFEYEAHWFTLALPIYLGLQRSWFPTEHATIELDDRWDEQRVLIVRVLFFTMRVVIYGCLFPDPEPE